MPGDQAKQVRQNIINYFFLPERPRPVAVLSKPPIYRIRISQATAHVTISVTKQTVNQFIYQITHSRTETDCATSTDFGNVLPRDLDQRLRRQQTKSTSDSPEFEKRPRSRRSQPRKWHRAQAPAQSALAGALGTLPRTGALVLIR